MTRLFRPTALLALALITLVAVGAAGCKPAVSADAIARVNSTDILKAAVDKQIAQIKKASPASFEGTAGAAVEDQYRAQIVNALIDQALVQEAGKSLGVSVTTKQVDDYIAGLEQQYGSKAALETAMKSAGFDIAMLREQITNSLLMEAVRSKVASESPVPTDAQIKAYYDANKSTFAVPEQVHAEHILFASKDKALAQQVMAKVKAGGDFAALAQQYSTDPGSKTRGGDLGWAASSTYVPEFKTAVDAMKVGQVRLVESTFGWHAIKLLGRRAATQQTLAEATSAVTQQLQQNAKADAFSAYIEGMRKKATIEIFDPALKKIIDQANAISAPAATP